ncbi:hypothetical protein EJ08DRAFT_218905 [Tothia fuscella]|uniref:Uncharacterized protein n=1 Tax=Tothia fuscella TaxID=1048955 RepID=A0A9P4NT28_9PEZI|nr:hypothetical protein EJ08DRAFT_218905 [Tothia fuscella]
MAPATLPIRLLRTNRLAALLPRNVDMSAININNPLQDKSFTGTVVGCLVAGIVILVLVFLLLCLYRDGSPFRRCCGGWKGKKEESGTGPDGEGKSDGSEISSRPSTSSSPSKGSVSPLSTPEKDVVVVQKPL